MKRRLAQPEQAIRILFFGFSLICLITAFLMPDRSEMLPGLIRICTRPGQTVKSYLDVGYGGLSGAFLNVAVVSLFASLLYCLPGSKADGVSVLAFFLTAGFGFWGITALTVWFALPGVLLRCGVKKLPVGAQANVVLFATGLSPLITDLLFRYPGVEWHGFTLQGFLQALAVGTLIGLILPAGLAGAGKVTRGYSLYGAAVPIGLTAFFLCSLLYKVLGGALPNSGDFPLYGNVGVADSFPIVAHGFCVVVFVGAILLGLCSGGSFKQYGRLLKDSGHNVDYIDKYGHGASLINFGVYGLSIVVLYDLMGANWNGATLGCVFCMACCAMKGSHPRNVLPIAAGYVLASLLTGVISTALGTAFALPLSAQAIVIGICFANGLSPMAGKYGFPVGVIAGAVHYILVTNVPSLHGGFCLYNGGFTCMFVCLLLAPILEQWETARKNK